MPDQTNRCKKIEKFGANPETATVFHAEGRTELIGNAKAIKDSAVSMERHIAIIEYALDIEKFKNTKLELEVRMLRKKLFTKKVSM